MIEKLNHRDYTLIKTTPVTKIYAILVAAQNYVLVRQESYPARSKRVLNKCRSRQASQSCLEFSGIGPLPVVRYIQFSREEFECIFGYEDCEYIP